MLPVPMNPTVMAALLSCGLERALSSRPVSVPSSRRRLRGLALICLAAMSWGTTGSVTAVLVRDTGATALVIGAVRMLVAGVLLLAAAWSVSGALRIAPADRWRCVVL